MHACFLHSIGKYSTYHLCAHIIYQHLLHSWKRPWNRKSFFPTETSKATALPLSQCSKLRWGKCWREKQSSGKDYTMFMKDWSKSNLALSSLCKSPDPPLSLPLRPQSDIPIFLCRHGWFYGPKRGTFHYFLGKAKLKRSCQVNPTKH